MGILILLFSILLVGLIYYLSKRVEAKSGAVAGDSFKAVSPSPSRKLVKEDFRLTGVKYYVGNIKKLSCANEDYRKSVANIVREDLVGERIYQHTYVNKPVKLIPEPSNAHDRNAIQVFIAGELVGYISREDNVHVRKLLKYGEIKYISAYIWGGKYKIVSSSGDIARFDEDLKVNIRIAYVEK